MIGRTQIDWRYVIFAPLWLRHSIIASVCMLPGIFSWYSIVIPVTDINQQLQTQLVTAEQLTSIYQQQWHSLPAIDQLKAQIQQIKGELKPYQFANSAGFLHLITDFLAASGCQLIDIGTPSVSEQERLTLYDWQLKVSADYFQLIELIRLINSETRLIAINRLTMEGGSRLTINMTVRLYQLNQDPI
ncbi:hypothetical protein LPW36_08910 [Jinshanibacter sp. LJY008]|uniref:Type IV pilus biogenesis protein PilO n=1 Tax=Limnobaculum eriocheiris TaxID=2897391 RepID=A0A9X1MX07_9GAMM|nr:hypothetical protein [Limnobaculum eriocheiris]MCD1126118.1 hypothetical protein [Limnobaculum eriocheiris]